MQCSKAQSTSVRLAAALLACALSFTPRPAAAEQPRDWMVGVQPDGNLLLLDLLFPGIQATYQYNRPIYAQANKLRLRANSLLTIPFYESQADAEIRLVVLTLGVGAGFRDVFRQQTFDEGESYTLGARRGTDSRSDYAPGLWGFGEFRAELSLPFNDTVVFHSRNAYRFEGRPDRSYDYRTGVVHDGEYFISDTWLFFKHRDYGAIAPTFEVLNPSIDGKRPTLFNAGLTMTMRPGFMFRNDLIYLQALVNIDGKFDTEQATYGAHMFYGPYTVLLAYRTQLVLDNMELF